MLATTGEMADFESGYNYTIITVGGAEYIFLDDFLDPTAMAINPFKAGRNPLSGDPATEGPHDICFVDGTHIRTPNGEIMVEDLQVGDLIVTRSIWLKTLQFSYHHILFEKHETIFSESLPTETFIPAIWLWQLLERRLAPNYRRCSLNWSIVQRVVDHCRT